MTTLPGKTNLYMLVILSLKLVAGNNDTRNNETTIPVESTELSTSGPTTHELHCDDFPGLCTTPSMTSGPTTEPEGERCKTEHLSGQSGMFQIPKGDRGIYKKDLRCIWIITVNKGKIIELQVSRIDIEFGKECLNDALEIYDGPDENSTLLAQICEQDSRNTVTVQSSGNQMYVKFRSDAANEHRGFEAEYTEKKKKKFKELKTGGDLKYFNFWMEDNRTGIENMLLGSGKKFTGQQKKAITFHLEGKSQRKFMLQDSSIQTKYAKSIQYTFVYKTRSRKNRKSSKVQSKSIKKTTKWTTTKMSHKKAIQRLSVTVVWDSSLTGKKERKVQLKNLFVKAML